MAIVIEANYSKKLGLPQYSSHQYSITLRTELSDISQVPTESARLYKLLQEAVDTSIQQVGFLPNDNHGNHANHANSVPIRHTGNGNLFQFNSTGRAAFFLRSERGGRLSGIDGGFCRPSSIACDMYRAQ